MGVHVSIGSLIDSVSKSIWNVWAPKKRLLVQERKSIKIDPTILEITSPSTIDIENASTKSSL